MSDLKLENCVLLIFSMYVRSLTTIAELKLLVRDKHKTKVEVFYCFFTLITHSVICRISLSFCYNIFLIDEEPYLVVISSYLVTLSICSI